MDPHRPYADALKTAIATVGGEKELAERLGVQANELHAWVEGASTPPLAAFLEALDVIAAGPYSRPRRRPRVAVLRQPQGTKLM